MLSWFLPSEDTEYRIRNRYERYFNQYKCNRLNKEIMKEIILFDKSRLKRIETVVHSLPLRIHDIINNDLLRKQIDCKPIDYNYGKKIALRFDYKKYMEMKI